MKNVLKVKLLALFMLVCASGFSQEASNKDNPEYKKVKLLNTGGLYSSYNLSLYPIQVKNVLAQTNQNVLDDILKYSTETSWPNNIKTLQERAKFRDLMNSYVVRYVAEVDSDKCVLIVYEKDNQHMPVSMTPNDHIYFIIKKSSVDLSGVSEKKEIVQYNNYSNQNSNTNEFSTQFNTILNGFINNFENLKGARLPSRSTIFTTYDYESKVKLEGSETSSIFTEKGIVTYFIAEYGTFKTMSEGKIKLNEVIAKMNNTTVNFGSLIKDDSNLENYHFVRYIPFGTKDQMNPVFNKISIEVKLADRIEIDQNNKAITVYKVSIVMKRKMD